jgi:hypothetical protein
MYARASIDLDERQYGRGHGSGLEAAVGRGDPGDHRRRGETRQLRQPWACTSAATDCSNSALAAVRPSR